MESLPYTVTQIERSSTTKVYRMNLPSTEPERRPALPTGWKGLSSVQLDTLLQKPDPFVHEVQARQSPGQTEMSLPEAGWKETSSVRLESLLPKSTTGGPGAASEDPVDTPAPPSLNYDLHARRLSLALNIFALVLFNAILPVLVFYLLLHYSDVSKIEKGDHNVLYGATTATLGTLQIPQWFWRWWNCYKKNASFIKATHQEGDTKWQRAMCSTTRSIECWDVFQWSFLAGIIVGSVTLVLGTCLNGNYGNWPLMALSPSAIFALIGAAFLVPTLLASWGLRSLLSLSGHPPGSHILPALAYMWPDLTAVDGGGGQVFRQSFNARWHASPPFRHMVTTLSWGIGLPLLLQLGPELLLVFLIERNNHWSFSQKAQYTWAPAWAILLATLLTQAIWACRYVRFSFRRERQWWHAMYRGEMHFD